MSSYQQVHGDGTSSSATSSASPYATLADGGSPRAAATIAKTTATGGGSPSDSFYASDRPRVSIDEEAGQADFTYTKSSSGGCGDLLRRHYRWFGLAAITILIILITVIIVARGRNDPALAPHPRNVILLIPDGTGFASLTMARVCKGSKLALDDILKGSIRTYSSDAWVTDSAASATAYASGQKTYNGAIGVDANQLPLGTLHEAAKRQGLIAGVIATSSITHATPAAFSSHVDSRGDELDIAVQQITKKLDFAIGGGRSFYTAKLRPDKRDLVANLTGQGYTVAVDRASFNTWAAKAASTATSAFPFFGLLADQAMEFEIDRSHGISDQPSLTQMIAPVFTQLSRAAAPGGAGFIVMIEGSRVDHAGHANDPATHMREALEFDAAVAAALKFREQYPDTLVISVADHETGGLTLGRDNVYNWYPEVLLKVNSSMEKIAASLLSGAPIDATILDVTGVTLTEAEHDQIYALVNTTVTSKVLTPVIGRIISQRAGIQWTTLGHTGVDIGLYAAGPADWTPRVSGAKENIDINRVIADYLSLDLDAVTRELRGL